MKQSLTDSTAEQDDRNTKRDEIWASVKDRSEEEGR
jgi:hypothetical protein